MRDLVSAFLVACVCANSLSSEELTLIDDFRRADSFYHGDRWETLNPGYWKIRDNSLRRRLGNVGDGNPITSFPWHWSTGGKSVEPRTGSRTPDLPMGMIWHRDWRLSGKYTLRATFTIRDTEPPGRGEQDGFFGVCFGGQSLYESRSFRRAASGDRSWMATWHRDGRFGVEEHGASGQASKKQPRSESAAGSSRPSLENAHGADLNLEAGATLQIEVRVEGSDSNQADLHVTWIAGSATKSLTVSGVDRKRFTDGYFGLACYGALDFEVNRVEIAAGDNSPAAARLNDLHVCYPLGDTLREVEGRWRCKFVALFRNPGESVELRIADSARPEGGWETIASAGKADIVDNEWRRYTAVLNVVLPVSPAEKTLYYTVWKDGKDVTPDPRPADPDAGYLGPKDYVGRLPRLVAPYRVCTLGGHALTAGGTTLTQSKVYQANWLHGQPTQNAYRHFEDYDFQIVNWDDDVWYLELLFPPPSTDDAYKVITLTIANPTTRWQMMRHWNVINPGDHDYGMDDVKGPEQILVRQHDDLGQDAEYMQRNFSINHHLVEGREEPITTENPEDWRLWRMPNGDFALIVLESRLWRSSQDTNIWVEGGWGHKRALYDRRDPTRTLLGEKQFAWLQEVIRTESAPLICITGINCMHPVFTGSLKDPQTGLRFANEDRVAADYSGWCTAGTDRLLELLGCRPGIISVYGDIHLASIVENTRQRVIEASCGPIGRGGSRSLKEDWAPRMKDYDGRDVQIHALYHAQYDSPDLHKRAGPPHWNFLEKEFDPRGDDPVISMKIRNIIDSPDDERRGGGAVRRPASSTGRLPSCSLPRVETLPDAEVRLSTLDGRPLRGARSLPDGVLPVRHLVGVEPGTRVILTSTDRKTVVAHIVTTLPLD